MKIGVCFKVLADYGLIGKNDWQIKPDHSLDLGFVRKEFNGFEESALELALRLTDQTKDRDGTIELCALTVDGPDADLFLRQTLAAGFKHAARIQPGDGIDLRFNPLLVSRILCQYITKTGRFKAMVFGEQGGVGDNGQTGFFTAEQLGWPCIRGVIDIMPGSGPRQLTVHAARQNHTLIQTIALPAVLIVGNAPTAPFLRVPTLPQKLAAAKKRIEIVSMAGLYMEDVNGELQQTHDRREKRLCGLERPSPMAACRMVPGNTCEQKAKNAYSLFLKERLAK